MTKLLPAFSEFFSACYLETGSIPTGMVLPDVLYDKLREEVGPRLVVVASDPAAGVEEMRIATDGGDTFLRRAPVTKATFRL